MSNFSRFPIKLLALRKSKQRTCLTVTFLRWGNGDCHYYSSFSVPRRKHVSVLSAVSVFQGPERNELLCWETFQQDSTTGSCLFMLAKLALVRCFCPSHVWCAQPLAVFLDVRSLVSYVIALDLLSVSWFLVMSGCFSHGNNTEFLRC